MSVDLDMTQVAKFAEDLRELGAEVAPKISGSLTRHANATARAARAAAPKDRPWLSTKDGVKVLVDQAKFTRLIYSGKDEDGESVGYRVEYGTSVQQPRPFLIPAFQRERKAFFDDAISIVSSAIDRAAR